jgi:hypothetical protein
MAAFGDRSYETAVAAIEKRFGSMQDFYKAHPNVAVMASDGGHHFGGGNADETLNAVGQGLDQIQNQMSGPSSQQPTSPQQTTQPQQSTSPAP